MPTDISTLDAQIAELQKQRQDLLNEQRDSKLIEIKTIIRQFGFTATDLGITAGTNRKPATATKPKLEPMYANPNNLAQTWHGGRGVKPKWVSDFIAGGGKLEDIVIKK
jgi:DNA-binding protein H-NS